MREKQVKKDSVPAVQNIPLVSPAQTTNTTKPVEVADLNTSIAVSAPKVSDKIKFVVVAQEVFTNPATWAAFCSVYFTVSYAPIAATIIMSSLLLTSFFSTLRAIKACREFGSQDLNNTETIQRSQSQQPLSIFQRVVRVLPYLATGSYYVFGVFESLANNHALFATSLALFACGLFQAAYQGFSATRPKQTNTKQQESNSLAKRVFGALLDPGVPYVIGDALFIGGSIYLATSVSFTAMSTGLVGIAIGSASLLRTMIKVAKSGKDSSYNSETDPINCYAFALSTLFHGVTFISLANPIVGAAYFTCIPEGLFLGLQRAKLIPTAQDTIRRLLPKH